MICLKNAVWNEFFQYFGSYAVLLGLWMMKFEECRETCQKDTLVQEGKLREELAVYFLSVPALSQQTEAQLEETRQALSRLLDVETEAVIRCSGISRHLLQGNLTGTLTALLEACCSVAQKAGWHFSVHVAPGMELPVTAAFEPRLLQMAVVGLIRAVCLANPHGTVSVSLTGRTNSLTVTVTGENPPWEERALAVAKETARIHQGSLVLADGTVGLSIRTTLDSPGGYFAYNSAADLLEYMLSSVQVGLFSALYPHLDGMEKDD